MHSTVEDLLLWDQALNSDRLVSAAAVQSMFTPFKNEYCCGWFRHASGERIHYAHSGAISGFATYVIRFPKEKMYVAVLSNFEWAKPGMIAEKLSGMLLNGE